ncbi:MAG: hypothetical protein JXB05_01855 [Myxococcaceae bacterium]|nr:hypothetical protein [Myxococcaceae bacterium]
MSPLLERLQAVRTSPAALLKGLAVLAALAMLAYRFANFDLVPFISDEPHFLVGANEQLRTGQWLSASPIRGTQGTTYGPTVLWFYGVIHLLFGDAPQTSILAMCITVTLAHAALALALTRLFRGDALFLAAMLALVAASPYQFFWSRLAWDQMVNVCASLAVVLLCLPGPLGWLRRVLLGVVLGFAVSSHLMVLPLVALTFAVLTLEQLRGPRSLALTLGTVLAVALLINLPYLGFLRANPPAPPPPPGAFSWPLLGENLLQPARVATPWGLAYFFDHAWPDFLQWLGGTGRWLLEHADWSTGVLITVSGAGLLVTLRAKEPEQRRVAWLALAVWLGYAVFYTHRGLERHPHYQFPTWWVVATGVAGALYALLARNLRLGTVATLVVLLGAGLQFLVNVAWMGYARERGGTQGIHYSSPLAAQQAVIRRLCEEAKGTVFLENHTWIFPPPLGYVARTTPACQGLNIHLCGSRGCPPGAPIRRLRYAAPVGGALVLE